MECQKLRHAVIRRQWWTIAGWLVLGLALGYITFVSIEVFAYQQSQGLNEGQALAQLGISAAAWQWQRSLLSVGLVALAGFNRYRPEVKSLQDEQSELERDLVLEPLRQRVREVKAVGAVNLTKSVAQATKGKGKPRPPTGGTPSAKPVQADEQAGQEHRPAVLRLPTPEPRHVARAKLTLRAKVFKALDEDGTLSGAELARRFRKGESTCSRYRSEWLKAHAEVQMAR